jgi:hypothetical protein
LPGFTATRQNTSREPSSESALRTRSCSPIETPPELTRTSCCSPSASAARVARREDDRVGARAAKLRGEQRRVRLVDLPGSERLTGTAQLAPGREDGDPGPPPAGDRRQPDCGKRTELRWAEHRPTLDDDVTRDDIASPGTDVFHRGNSFDHDLAAVTTRHLHGHDRVGAVRDDRAGRDPDRLAALERACRGRAGSRLVDDEQPARRVGATHRVAVHRRARERWQVDHRSRVLGEDATRGIRHRHLLTAEEVRLGEHERERLVDRREGRHRFFGVIGCGGRSVVTTDDVVVAGTSIAGAT